MSADQTPDDVAGTDLFESAHARMTAAARGEIDDEPSNPDDEPTYPDPGGDDVDAGGQADEAPIEVDVVRVAQHVIEQGQALTDLASTVAEHDGMIERLVALIEELTPGGPWDWATLGLVDRGELWKTLGQWVARLEARYLIQLEGEKWALPGCWYRHPVAVEILTALMVAHLRAYNALARKATFEPSDWHLRHLVMAFDFLQQEQVFKRCQRGHEDRIAREPAHDPIDFADFVQADLERAERELS